ncbi:MAG: HAMP domain-containing histidine kinase [Saprospiraceae bacterium]|nr:HAMP domain-containing histidine kinase [Saprospiraceae bacterium]
MTRHLITGILLLSLSVLTYVQFRLLMSGVRLEKQRFDLRTEDALLAVSDTLNLPGSRSDALIDRLKIRQIEGDTVLVHPISDSIEALLKRELVHRGIRADFAFAITPVFNGQVLLASKGYKPDKFDFGKYQARLGNHIIGNCHFESVLHFDVFNLFGYLLGQLRNLLVPSVLSLLAILSCLLLLLNILKKERQLNAIKNDFINNLTHELKTPAFSISLSNKMAKEYLEKGDLQRAKGFLQIIEKENAKVKAHVEKVLELASLESAYHNLQKAPTSIHAMIKELEAEFLPMVMERNGTMTLHLRADPDTTKVDAAHLKNALRNLLDNALKYSHAAPVIEISTERKDKQLLIAVSDQGIGIEPAQQKLVFDKFYRIPGSGVQTKGFGLGLSYVAQIVSAHGGKILLESEKGKGTKFTLIIPN